MEGNSSLWWNLEIPGICPAEHFSTIASKVLQYGIKWKSSKLQSCREFSAQRFRYLIRPKRTPDAFWRPGLLRRFVQFQDSESWWRIWLKLFSYLDISAQPRLGRLMKDRGEFKKGSRGTQEPLDQRGINPTAWIASPPSYIERKPYFWRPPSIPTNSSHQGHVFASPMDPISMGEGSQEAMKEGG